MPMQGTSENVLTGFQFSLEVDGVGRKTFTSIDGIGITVESIETWGSDAGAKIFEQKIAGKTSYSDLTIVANMTPDSFLRDWRLEVVQGKYSGYRRNGSVVMYDTELTEQARFNFENAWPSAWSLGSLTAGSSAALTETVTVVVERIVRA